MPFIEAVFQNCCRFFDHPSFYNIYEIIKSLLHGVCKFFLPKYFINVPASKTGETGADGLVGDSY